MTSDSRDCTESIEFFRVWFEFSEKQVYTRVHSGPNNTGLLNPEGFTTWLSNSWVNLLTLSSLWVQCWITRNSCSRVILEQTQWTWYKLANQTLMNKSGRKYQNDLHIGHLVYYYDLGCDSYLDVRLSKSVHLRRHLSSSLTLSSHSVLAILAIALPCHSLASPRHRVCAHFLLPFFGSTCGWREGFQFVALFF